MDVIIPINLVCIMNNYYTDLSLTIQAPSTKAKSDTSTDIPPTSETMPLTVPRVVALNKNIQKKNN